MSFSTDAGVLHELEENLHTAFYPGTEIMTDGMWLFDTPKRLSWFHHADV